MDLRTQELMKSSAKLQVLMGGWRGGRAEAISGKLFIQAY